MSTDALAKRNPSVLWSQRTKTVTLTVEVEDLTVEELKIEGNLFVFKGHNKDSRYDVQLELYGELKWDEHKRANSSRHLEVVVPKQKEEWWPRLLKAAGKTSWIKVDFDKWIDEEDALEEEHVPYTGNPFAEGMEGIDFGNLPSPDQYSAGLEGLGADDEGEEEVDEGAGTSAEATESKSEEKKETEC